MQTGPKNYDAVVVGHGVAGLAAAVAAAEGGAKVALLERADRDNRGGNSRYTEAWMRMKDEENVSDDFFDRLGGAAHGAIPPDFLKESSNDYSTWPQSLKSYAFTDPEIITAFADNAPPTIAWIKSHGVRLTQNSVMLLQGGLSHLGPSGGGIAIVEAMGEAAEKLGVDILYETTGRSLVLDDRGDVAGLRAWAPGQGLFTLNAKSVVLACGGYQGNVEMMTRYVGANAYLTRPVSPGGIYNKGEGIEMGLAAGAAPAGQYEMFHGEPVDPRSARAEALIAVLNYGIMVNNSGERFIDEGRNKYELIYDDLSWATMRQKDGIAYFVFDSRLLEIPNIRVRIKTDMEPYRASSIKEMAAKINVPEAALAKTFHGYNAAVQDGEFDHTRLDGKGTDGLLIPKSNWARKIDEKDLYAYPVMCANTFTCGGLKISRDAEVLNRDGYPIVGLYAAGETVGMYYRLYVGATSVLRGLVFGRLAGKKIAASLKR
jgi:tricarballylate dehydrogenase